VPNILFIFHLDWILAKYLPSLLFCIFFLTYLLPYSFTFWVIYLLLPEAHSRGIRGQPNLALVFLALFCVVVYFVVEAYLLLLCLIQFFSTKPRDWLGRTSPKWSILCWVGFKTLTQLLNQSGTLQPATRSPAAVISFCCVRWRSSDQMGYNPQNCLFPRGILTAV